MSKKCVQILKQFDTKYSRTRL